MIGPSPVRVILLPLPGAMVALNARETRVLLILALILATGGVVRLISAHRPHWTPGVVGGTGPSGAPVRPEDVPYGTAEDLDSLFVEGRMDLNAAGEEHLVLLPRIGPALAGRIVAWREEHGSFTRVDDLIHIRGIGPKTLETLRPHVCVR